MRVLKGLVVSLKSCMPLIEKPLVLSAALGGERQRSSVGFDTGYSEKAHCIGKPAYLEPNSNSMQKPIEGSILLLKNVEDRSAIGGSRNQKHAEKTERSSHSQTPHKTGKTRAKTNISRTAS